MKGMAEHNDGMARKLVSTLEIGKAYSLDSLAYLIGQQPNALRGKGVITKSGCDFQFLMVTLEKDQWSTQGYVDHLDKSTLFWSGQNRQKAVEKRLKDYSHDTFIFIQQKRKTPYIYYGRAIPKRTHIIWELGVPSLIVFNLPEYKELLTRNTLTSEDDYFSIGLESLKDDIPFYEPPTVLETDKTAITKIRLAQGAYRKKVIEFWNGNCSVTGVDETSWLIASHIKPWVESSRTEKLDPHNSLLLTPNFDKLFDRGVISFSPSDGRIILPEVQTKKMWANFNRMHITEDIKLRNVPTGVGEYLEYHNYYVYGFSPSDGILADDFVESLIVKGLS